uniref:Uncharacterized protein n=1 Tax=Aegilops tauschii subsp. strangulata TaxID=200361 RepID=A0A453K796_AEGTS
MFLTCIKYKQFVKCNRSGKKKKTNLEKIQHHTKIMKYNTTCRMCPESVKKLQLAHGWCYCC